MVVTAKFSASQGIIFNTSLNFNCQISPLHKLGSVGEAKYPKHQNSFSRNHRITVEAWSNYQNRHLTVNPSEKTKYLNVVHVY